MPVIECDKWPEPLRNRTEVAGLFVGGCVDRGDGSSFRSQAHAHISGSNLGWICVRAAWRLNEDSLIKHELAHILSGQGHTEKFRRVLAGLHGGVLPKGERMVPRQASWNCRATYHGLCRGKTEAHPSIATHWYEGGKTRLTWSKEKPVSRCRCWCHARESEGKEGR